MSRKRVLICIPVLLKGGGTEIQVSTLAEVLIAGGYQVAVCCYYEFDQSIVELFRQKGAEMILLGLDRSDGRFGLSKIFQLIRKLSQIFQRYHPDVVHVQYLAPGLIPIIAARLAGIPTVFATVHIAGSVAYGRKAKLLLRVASCFCTAFFCVSKGVEEFWFGDSEEFDPQKISRNRKHFTIYNAVDIAKIDQIINRLDCEERKSSFGITGKRVLGIVGRLCKQKGQTILLDALTEVVNKVQGTRVLIVGDGPDKDELQEKANILGLDKYIRWLGAFPQEEVFRLYAVLDVLVMPSLYEGFGLTAAEAMAAGKPVVASNVEGLSEIVQHGVNGLLVPPGDKDALSAAITQLLADPKKAALMGDRGRQVVMKDFSLKRFQSTILAAYTHLSPT